VRCNRCEKHWWQPTPENEKAKRPARHHDLVARYDGKHCELCGLPKPSLLDLKRHLTGHHVIEYANGGTDARENVWIVCNACHSLIHRTRDYYGVKGGPTLASAEEDAA
jgi:5-methylcytosine-specific restriction endonuclease McrA